MKRNSNKRIKAFMPVFIAACLLVSSCNGRSSNNSYQYDTRMNDTTKITETTTAKTKKTYYISKSDAISLAKKYIEKAYTDPSSFGYCTDSVFFGDASCDSSVSDDSLIMCYVDVSGHYWKKDKYGNTGSKYNFTKRVTINKEAGKAVTMS